MKNVLLLLLLLPLHRLQAQISPPGLGETHSAYWSATGVNQKLDTKNSSLTYIGSGRINGPQGENPLDKPSIFVVNEEIYHTVNRNFSYSYALSYRRQHHYTYKNIDAEADDIQQEYRAYGRMSYTLSSANFKWKNTLRQEVRRFFTADFADVKNSLQLRTRIKTQVSAGLDANKVNNITASAEALFSDAHNHNGGWAGYSYGESRFCLYYTYKPETLPVTFDLGYMNDLIGHGHSMTDASYVAVDIILENPF